MSHSKRIRDSGSRRKSLFLADPQSDSGPEDEFNTIELVCANENSETNARILITFSRSLLHFPRREQIILRQQLPTFDPQFTLMLLQLRHSMRQLRNTCPQCSPLHQLSALFLQILFQMCHILLRNGKRRNLLPNSELNLLPTFRILQPSLALQAILPTQPLLFTIELIQISQHQNASTSSWI